MTSTSTTHRSISLSSDRRFSGTPTDRGRRLEQQPRQRRKQTAQLVALDADWARASRRPTNLRRARAWPLQVEDPGAAHALATALQSISSLDELVAATDRTGHRIDGDSLADPDEVLGALVRVAANDDLAARVVLQRVTPAIISASNKYRRMVFNDERTDLAIGAAWLVVRSFDVERRRRNIAAAIVSDVMWIAFRAPARRKSQCEIPTPHEVFARTAADPVELDPITALAATVRAAAAAGIEDRDLDLIRELARVGSPGEVARRIAVTPRTVRNHRDSATHHIRSALGPDWGDWREQLTAAA